MLKYQKADFSLDGKTALITGGANGIGYATAEFFVKKGANVVLADLNPDVEIIAQKLNDEKAVGIISNITKASECQKALQKGIDTFGKIDILINCAGIVALEKAELISENDWDRTMEINLKGSFLMAQTAGNYFIQNKICGSIVNMASQAGVIALDKHVAYCASKGAIIAMTKVLALEWGQYGIRVNAVSPTVVLTELGHKAWDGEVGEIFKQKMPSKRFAEPDEIASTIAFLCSSGAGMITGHNLVVDGGYTIQ